MTLTSDKPASILLPYSSYICSPSTVCTELHCDTVTALQCHQTGSDILAAAGVMLPCMAGKSRVSDTVPGWNCSGAAVLTVVELVEEAGLPPLCIAMAEETDADRVVGEVLAEAVKVHLSHYIQMPRPRI